MNNVKGLTEAGSASRMSKLLILLHSVSEQRHNDLVATTDAHRRPVRVHAQIKDRKGFTT